MEGDYRYEPVLMAGLQHAAVMVEFRHREVALLGLDAGPLQGEAVTREPQAGDQGNVLAVPVVVVDGVPGRFGEDRSGEPLQEPAVTVDIVSLDLVGCRGEAPQEIVREGKRVGHLVPFDLSAKRLCMG